MRRECGEGLSVKVFFGRYRFTGKVVKQGKNWKK